MMKSLLWLIGSTLCCAVTYQGCSSLRNLGDQAVKDVLANPREFNYREIAVAGTVGNNFAVMGVGYFQLVGDDGRGHLDGNSAFDGSYPARHSGHSRGGDIWRDHSSGLVRGICG